MCNINYAIVGAGKMARHMDNYFNFLGVKHLNWKRGQDISILRDADIVLILISDDSIGNFIKLNPILKEKKLIHFSGALELPGVTGYHPLMTFGDKLYTLDEYQKIPFIGTSNTISFKESFPFLVNNYYKIPQEKKALYHGLCVLGGNFTTILWQKVIKDFEENLAIPREVLFPYMEKIISNIKLDSQNALTGPIKRQNKTTIKKNIKTLGTLWGKIYKLFNRAYLRGIK